MGTINTAALLSYLNRQDHGGDVELARIPFVDWDETPIVGGQLAAISIERDELDGRPFTTLKATLRTTDGNLVQLGTSAVLVGQIQDLAGIARNERMEPHEEPETVRARMGGRLNELCSSFLVFIFIGMGEAQKGKQAPRLFQVARFRGVRDMAELAEHVTNMRQEAGLTAAPPQVDRTYEVGEGKRDSKRGR